VPLYHADLLQPNVFTWNHAATQAFTTLKQLVTTVSVMTLPDFTIHFGPPSKQAPLTFFSKMTPHRLATFPYTHELYIV